MPVVRRHDRGVHRRPVRYRRPVVTTDVTEVTIGGRVVVIEGGGGVGTLHSATESGPIAG